MASIDFTPRAPTLRAVFARIAARLANAAESYAAAQSRADQVARLNAKSDADLASMGLRRDDIARYVFRDILYI